MNTLAQPWLLDSLADSHEERRAATMSTPSGSIGSPKLRRRHNQGELGPHGLAGLRIDFYESLLKVSRWNANAQWCSPEKDRLKNRFSSRGSNGELA
jgi:hypothetical protein